MRARWPHVRRAASLAVLGLALSTPPVAQAQLATLGAVSSIPAPTGTGPLRWPDVAYDPDHDVYLAVSGAGLVGGYWVAGDGTPMGAAFTVESTGAYAQAPRVAFASGVGFVVTWHETLASGAVRIRARVVPYGGTPGADFDVSPTGTNWEMGAALAWSSTSQEALVAWQSTVDTRIGAQRVSATGTLLGAPIVVDPRAIYFRDPAVAYHAATDTFFVAYAGCVGTNDCFVDVQRVRAGTGELIGAPIELDASIGAGYVPELAYAAATGDVLAVWYRSVAGSVSFSSRLVHGDGTTAATTLVTSSVGSYDANSVAYAPVSGTFLFVTHGTTAQDVAIELSAAGAPLGAPIPFGSASAGGNFNPRVAAHTGRAEWLAVTSTDFAALGAQRFETATRDPSTMRDAGAVDGGGLANDAGASVPDASSADAGARPDAGRPRASASGCGCRVGAGSSLTFPLALALVLAALVRRRA